MYKTGYIYLPNLLTMHAPPTCPTPTHTRTHTHTHRVKHVCTGFVDHMTSPTFTPPNSLSSHTHRTNEYSAWTQKQKCHGCKIFLSAESALPFHLICVTCSYESCLHESYLTGMDRSLSRNSWCPLPELRPIDTPSFPPPSDYRTPFPHMPSMQNQPRSSKP